MPIYEFECQDCGNVDEQITIKNVVAVECSKCKGLAHRIISVSNFKIGGNYKASNGYSIVKGDETNVRANV